MFRVSARSVALNKHDNVVGGHRARGGHVDRSGLNDTIYQKAWNSAHMSRGCTQPDLIATGGNGYLYCFAINP